MRASQAQFPFLRNLAEQILALNDGTPQQQLTAQTLGISLLMLAAQMPVTQQDSVVRSSASLLTRRIKDYIDAHYTEALKLEDIAAALGCSVPYLAHTFKDATGLFADSIRHSPPHRLGADLLISTDHSATRIATMVGYDNTNYFNSLFTRIVGTTPDSVPEKVSGGAARRAQSDVRRVLALSSREC